MISTSFESEIDLSFEKEIVCSTLLFYGPQTSIRQITTSMLIFSSHKKHQKFSVKHRNGNGFCGRFFTEQKDKQELGEQSHQN